MDVVEEENWEFDKIEWGCQKIIYVRDGWSFVF